MTPEEKRAYDKVYYEANREAILKQKRAYRVANKEVLAKRYKAYYEANKEAIAEKKRPRSKAYYEANKETIAEKRVGQYKAYYEANKGAIAETKKAYREANKKAIAERMKAYREANKGVIAEKRKRYKANKKSAIPDFLKDCPQERARLVDIYKLRAVVSEATGIEHHVDHMWPLSKGGPHWSGNLQIIPAQDNLSKKDRVCRKTKATIKEALKWAEENYCDTTNDQGGKAALEGT